MAPHVVHGARSLSKIQPCRKRTGEICLGASDGVFKFQPCASPHAMALESVQPVPWVLAVCMRVPLNQRGL